MTELKRNRFDIPYTDPAELFAHYHDRPYALFMDSSDRAHPDARFSFIAFDPIETIACTYKDAPFEQLENVYQKYNFGTHAPDPDYPFTGGMAGVFGYDLGRSIEDIPLPSHKTPSTHDMMIGVYTHVIAFDHVNETAAYFVWGDSDIPVIPSEVEESLQYRNIKDPSTSLGTTFRFTENISSTQNKQNIQTVIDYITQGDIFQANIAKHRTGETPETFCPWTHYKTLRCVSPAPFGGYFNIGDTKIASVSPERFLSVSHDGMVHTKPIKGTLPADQDANILLNSAKDRAENIMIVDLLRNDLSKTCTPDSVTVTKLCELETFKSVHHLVSTVQGQLQSDKTPIDILKTCFPGGSITGAPKIRAMEIIDELEPFTRGFYCGAMGYIGFDGAMDTNIIIRTLIYDGNTVTLHAGSGITAQSDPTQEDIEMNDKARAILGSFYQ